MNDPHLSQYLSPQEDRTWSLLVGVMMWLPVELDTFLERTAGISHSEYRVLRCLSTNKNHELHMSQLASNASVTPSHLSRVMARLEKRQWITRSSDRDDARRTLALLTEPGARIVNRVEPGYAQEIQRCVFDVLDPVQAEQLEGLSEAILTSLHPEPIKRRI